jgi:cysteinyl-tRNA synthetase
VVRAASAARAAFDEALSDDLNTSAGLAAMFDLVRTVNTAIDQKQIGEPDVPTVRHAFSHFDKVLGVLSLRRIEDRQPPIPEDEIQAAIEARQAARRARNFAEADRIRDDMAARGVLFEDSPQGTRWKRK